MPVLVEGDATRANALVASLPIGSQVVPNIGELESRLTASPDEFVVALGPETDLREATLLAEALRQVHPRVGIVLIRDVLEGSVYAEAMQAGIRAVVATQDARGLSQAVSRLRESWEAMHGPASPTGGHDGRVITIFSPKGGVGKTTIAVNLAVALSGGGNRKVCIVDLDLAFGDVAITLQLIPQHTIVEAVGVEDHLDFALLETLLTRHEQGIAILAAPTDPEGKDRIPPTLIRSVLQTLRKNFDFVVVDTSPAFDDQVLQAFDETDECLLVATLDVPTVKNVKVAMETLDLLDIAKGHRHLILNRADDEVGLSPGNVEDILGMSISTSMPSDLAVANATNHGRPIVLVNPEHAVSKALLAFAKGITGEDSPKRSPGNTSDDTSNKRGIFARRRRT